MVFCGGIVLTFIHHHFPLGVPSGPPALGQERKSEEPVRGTFPFPSPAPLPDTPLPFPTSPPPFTFPPGLAVFPGPRYHDLGLERPFGVGLRVCFGPFSCEKESNVGSP